MLAALMVGTALTLAPQVGEVAVPRPGSLDLRALADQIDPGEVPPLRTLLHAKLRQRLDAYLQTAELPELAPSLRAMADTLDERVPVADRVPVDEELVLDAALLLYRADRDVPDDGVGPLTTVAYFFAAGPEANAGFTPRIRTLDDATLRFAAARWALEPDLVGWLERQRQDFDDHTDRLHRALAGRVLRNTDLGEHVPAVLLQLAWRAALLGDYDRALPLFEERIRRLGKGASVGDWLKLVRAYYFTADPQRGRAAGEHAKRIDAPADADLIGAFTASQPRLERIGTLLARDGLDDGLAAGELLLAEVHKGPAKRLFERLAAAYPSDARPVVGSARCAASSTDLPRASVLLRRAWELENKDIHYCEIETFVRWYVGAFDEQGKGSSKIELLASQLETLRACTTGLQAGGHEQAEVWREICDLGLEFVPLIDDDTTCRTFLRGLLPRVIDLQRRHPSMPAAYKAVLVAAPFSEDDTAALDLLRQSPPPSFPAEALDSRRASTWLTLAALTGRTELLDQFEPIVTAVADPCQGAVLSGVRHAVLARARAESSLWHRAAADFAAALTTAPNEQRAQLNNNLGVALAELGKTEEARRALELSINADTATRSFADYNGALLDLRAGQPASAVAATLAALPGHDDSPWPAARIWAGELLRRDHREEEAKPLFAESLHDQGIVPGEPDANRAGVAFTKSVFFGAFYSGKPPRLWLDLRLDLDAWLILPPPLTREQVREIVGK